MDSPAAEVLQSRLSAENFEFEAVESPQETDVHQLTSLVLFALEDYRSAASAAQVGLSLGKHWDWPTLRGQYAAAKQYTPQMRALERYRSEHDDAAHGIDDLSCLIILQVALSQGY